MAYTYETALLNLLRVLINDLDEVPVYTNDRLRTILIAAAFQVNQEASFVTTFTIDLAAQTITPDPTTGDSKDENFVNITCLKAACIVDTGNAIKAAGKAVAGRDMNAVQFDLTGVASSTLALLKQGWCKVYEDVLYDYVAGPNNLGKAVMGPFRTLTHAYYRYIQ